MRQGPRAKHTELVQRIQQMLEKLDAEQLRALYDIIYIEPAARYPAEDEA